MVNLIIKQGDSYNLSIPVIINGQKITSTTGIDKIEFLLNGLDAKYYLTSNTEVTFDSVNNVFLYPITQDESFSLAPEIHKLDIRVLYTNDEVRGIIEPIKIQVVGAVSNEILS